MSWKTIDTAPLDQVVETKIDDANGVRNETSLIQKQLGPGFRPRWWFPDMRMYVYYQPTHWRPLEGGTA